MVSDELRAAIHDEIAGVLERLPHLHQHPESAQPFGAMSSDALAPGDSSSGTGGGEDGGSSFAGGGDDGGFGTFDAGFDSMTPTYITINPDGSIGALFTGGVQLNEGAGLVGNANNMAAWVDPTTKALREYIEGYLLAGQHRLHLAAEPDGVSGSTRAYLELGAIAGGAPSEVTAGARDAVNNVLRGATIINGLNNSSFLKLANVADQSFARGVAQVTVAANTQFTIAHGLPAAPSVCMAFSRGGNAYFYNIATPDATFCKFACSIALNAAFLDWFAVT